MAKTICLFFLYFAIDYIFVILPENADENEFLRIFNTFQKNLKFTLEREQFNKLNFLDVLISNNNGKITTSWYRKPSHTLMFNPWDSHGPKIYKTNLIKTMVNRLKSICSNEIIFKRDLQQLKQSFLWSGYPNYIIEKFVSFALKPKHLKGSVLDVPRRQVYFGFQYINESSGRFVQDVSKLISKNFGFIKCIPYFKKGRNLLSYFSSKIKEFIRDTSTGVYRIPCDDCAQCYIGQTKRALTIRLREHQENCRYHRQNSAVVDHSALGHSWGFDRAVVVNTQRNTIKRKIAESLFIKSHSTVHGNKSSFPLGIFKL